MNDKTKQAIVNFAELTPKSIDVPVTHCTDRNLLFEISIAAFNANEALSDVNEEISSQIQEHHFTHEKELIDSVKHDVGLIVEFLKYQQRK